MPNETKPVLTEAEWQRISAPLGLTSTIDQIANELRERGLIAPEPVDALRDIARDAVARKCGVAPADVPGHCNEVDYVLLGMELAPAASPLTREMVREAVIGADPNALVTSDFQDDVGSLERQDAETFIDALHAALQGQSK